ncbi:unnamed protein product [Bursaphelenchus xylophilus]|uniref:(pine wood nematode) hypothetical protein n=1 Tax=Bursaphelenchus xylophilus TaxID=6326 RepID=A0A1I7STX2_BURXY|nr:unnamed protein product [Bursaphelenchus xylophilus]CAG9107844.1 unnamed protein product [Bursaphelenchus xylophilus]
MGAQRRQKNEEDGQEDYEGGDDDLTLLPPPPESTPEGPARREARGVCSKAEKQRLGFLFALSKVLLKQLPLPFVSRKQPGEPQRVPQTVQHQASSAEARQFDWSNEKSGQTCSAGLSTEPVGITATGSTSINSGISTSCCFDSATQHSGISLALSSDFFCGYSDRLHSTGVQCSPQPPVSTGYRRPAENQQNSTNSSLSDALLLALRRSRPNTRLFRVLFQYIPLRDSPNDNPHLELPLQAGDYLLVHGQMDEDQFYFGETLSGRTGLVPSNYVERIPDHVLLQNASRAPSPQCNFNVASTSSGYECPESAVTSTNDPELFLPLGMMPVSHRSNPGSRPPSRTASVQASRPGSPRSVVFEPRQHSPRNMEPLLMDSGAPIIDQLSRPSSPSFTLNVPPHLTQINHDFTVNSSETQLPDSICPYPPVDVSKVSVQEIKQPDKPKISAPRELTVEKKLSRSVVLSWLPPDDQLTAVSQYHVCVEGVVKAVVPGTYKCKALIEDLNLDKAVNVSVRSVTDQGHSADAACTLAVGAEAPVAPQHVRVAKITPVSACISWYPSNSNAEHILLLNAIKIGVCPPAVYQVQLFGLSPSTIYRISVRTKHPKAVLEQRPVERCVDFKTLPKIGLPDPPSNVQVDSGPQPGTLLVSWRPVTTQPRPPSRAAVHSYLIYADGQNIAQVPSVTADHVLLRLSDFSDDPPIFITVRTRTKEGAISADSNVVRVPRNVLGLPFGPTTSTADLPDTMPYGVQKIPVYNPQPGQPPPVALNGVIGPCGYEHNQNIAVSGSVMHDGGLLTMMPQQGATANCPPLNSHPNYSSYNMPSHFTNQPQAILDPNDPSNVSVYQPAMFDGFKQFQTETPITFRPQITRPHPHKLLGRQSTSALLQNNGSLSLPKYASMYEWKQPQQNQQQYYTFHPKALYKDYNTTEEKPSVLEMENNYLLRHRQQQQLNKTPAYETWDPRYDTYSRHDPASRGRVLQTGRRAGNIMSASNFEPRLNRVKSEEMLGTRSEPDLRPTPLDDENCRWFVALFNYDHHMSPNPNAAQEELSFRKHQLIKVFGEVDQDGFYKGQIGRRYGLVPSNMVIEIAKDDIASHPRRLPPEVEYKGTLPRTLERSLERPMERSLDPATRRSRWGSIKSRSYDYPDRRPYHSVGHETDQYSSLDRRDQYIRGRHYDYYDVHAQPGGSVRPGGYAPRYSKARNGYERSASYEPRGGLPKELREGRDIRDSRDIRDPRDQEYRERDYRDSRDTWDPYSRREAPARREAYEHEYRREGATVRGGERFEHPGEKPSSVYPPRKHEYVDRYDKGRAEYSDDTYPPSTSRLPQEHQYQKQGSQETPQGYSQQQHQVPPQQITTQSQQQKYQGNHVGPQTQQHQQQPQPVQQQTSQAMSSFEETLKNIDMLPTTKMIAKYDYDSRRLSPNVDAEQVELSFREGDLITLYGDVDEDGFFIGELNGVRGLVPSNFLQPIGNSLTASNVPQQAQQPPPGIMAGPVGAYGPTGTTEQRPKGVAFSDLAKKTPPMRQTSQTSVKTAGPTGPTIANTKPKSSSGAGQTGMVNKTGAKKSDPAKGNNVANNVRKQSQAVKKDPGKKK